jgi:carboxylate-amine ligase
MTTFGMEEELMLLKPDTLEPVDVAAPVLAELLKDPDLGPYLNREFLASQFEYSSPIFHETEEALEAIGRFRHRAAQIADRYGAVAASIGMPFDAKHDPTLSDAARYRKVAAEYGGVARDHQINALHVHVAVPSRADGVEALNRVRPWLPVLLAMSGNSPFWQGRDTGFSSWRSMQMRRWTTSGCPPFFSGESDYERRLSALVGVGGTTDVATVAWNARISENNPTIEIRVFDAQLDAEHSVLFAVLSRALVRTALDGGLEPQQPDPEFLDASLWLATRDGLTGKLVHPPSGERRAASAVVDALLVEVAEALEAHGDTAFAAASTAQLIEHGTGAERQRRAWSDGGPTGLSRLLRGAGGVLESER